MNEILFGQSRVTGKLAWYGSDKNGPWIGDWMIKAHYKQAASRLKIFIEHKGAKGDFAEAGNVRAVGISLVDVAHPESCEIEIPGLKAVQTKKEKAA